MCALWFVLPSFSSTCAVFLFLLVARDIVLLWTFSFLFAPNVASVLHASVLPGILVALRTIMVPQRWTSKALWPTSKTMLIWAQPLKGLLLLLSYEGIPKRLEGAIANCRTLSKTNNGARVIVAAPNFLINGRKTNAVYLKQAFSCLDSITTSLFIQIRPLPGKQGIDSVSVAKILQRQA